jgi:hypothetical protein
MLNCIKFVSSRRWYNENGYIYICTLSFRNKVHDMSTSRRIIRRVIHRAVGASQTSHTSLSLSVSAAGLIKVNGASSASSSPCQLTWTSYHDGLVMFRSGASILLSHLRSRNPSKYSKLTLMDLRLGMAATTRQVSSHVASSWGGYNTGLVSKKDWATGS